MMPAVERRSPSSVDSPAFSFLPKGGATGALVRSIDWSATSLGPPEMWSPALKMTLGIVFHSRHPMIVWWGHELIQFYNDAYMPSLGGPDGRHPRAMGQRGKECWPEVWAVISPQISDVMEQGIPSWNEDQLVPIHRNGKLEDVYWTYGYSPIYELDGSIGGTLVVCQETTLAVANRRALEEAHRQTAIARARLEDLIQRAPAFVCTLDGPEHVFYTANPPYQALIGRRDVIGKPLLEALPEVAEQGFIELLDRVYRTGEPFVGNEIRVDLDRCGDGVLEEIYVNFVYQPRSDGTGAVEGIDVFGFEVTEQVRARKAALAAIEESRQFAEAIPQQVWSATPDGALDFVNERVTDYFQTSREKILGGGWLGVIHPDDTAQVVASWTHSLATGTPYEVEFRLRRSDGLHRWHLGRAMPVRDTTGRIYKWFGTNTDIHEAKSIREELARRTEFEQHLVGIVSHDLRNPLNAILLGAQTLAMLEELDPRSAKVAMRMQSAAERGARMIRDLLDFTQARLGGGLPIKRSGIDVHQVTSTVLDEIRAAHPERELVMEHEGDGGGEWDGDRIAQAIANLVSNAIHHGDEGQPVRIRSKGTDDHVVIDVHNHGPVIPTEALATLFEPLKRGADQLVGARRSIGLGLYIVNEIAKRHDGTIELRSSAEAGTTFTLRLPRQPRPES